MKLIAEQSLKEIENNPYASYGSGYIHAMLEHIRGLESILKSIEWRIFDQANRMETYSCPVCGGEKPVHNEGCYLEHALTKPSNDTGRE